MKKYSNYIPTTKLKNIWKCNILLVYIFTCTQSVDETISKVMPFFFSSSIKNVLTNAAPGGKTPPL